MDEQQLDQESWAILTQRILQLEQAGLVKRTFRRLDPQRQIAIVDAILYEAGEKGIKTIGISEVAARAGVAVGSMYQYFPNRQGMIDFAIDLSVHYLIDAVELYRQYLDSYSLYDGLLAFVNAGVEMSRTQQGMLRFYGRAAYQGDPELSERVVKPVADCFYSLVRDLLEKARARGEIRADVDIEAITRLINTLLIISGDCQLFPYLNTYMNLLSPEISPDRINLAMVSMLQAGIGAHSTTE
ncbi:MAG: TetR/AcrR family transcriptional regulator [Anaerolineaceae bacterium]|nr:TetR/AcrR family transcriptional regulator [Anaerolineaceae bacterium]